MRSLDGGDALTQTNGFRGLVVGGYDVAVDFLFCVRNQREREDVKNLWSDEDSTFFYTEDGQTLSELIDAVRSKYLERKESLRGYIQS